MAETFTPVRPVSVDYECDKCHNGHMRSTGVMLTSDPPQYPHECDECGHAQTFDRMYPYVYYETAPEGERR